MNKKGAGWFAWIVIGMLLLITLAVTIEPLKETLDSTRSKASGMNCPGTSDFDQTSYDAQNTFEKLTYRTTCFATGLTMVYFVGSVLIAGIIWGYSNWRKK